MKNLLRTIGILLAAVLVFGGVMAVNPMAEAVSASITCPGDLIVVTGGTNHSLFYRINGTGPNLTIPQPGGEPLTFTKSRQKSKPAYSARSSNFSTVTANQETARERT